MARLLFAYLGFDVALRAYLDRAGTSPAARGLAQAGVELRRAAAAQVLAEMAAEPDPKADLRAILQAAIIAGVDWQDLAALVNTIRDRNPGGR